MKNRLYRQDISRPKPRHGHRYTRYNMYLSIMMVICIKQQPSNQPRRPQGTRLLSNI